MGYGKEARGVKTELLNKYFKQMKKLDLMLIRCVNSIKIKCEVFYLQLIF